MHKLIMLYLAGFLGLVALASVYAGGAADQPIIPCDQPGADPGGTTPLDNTTAPCDTGVINDTGNTSMTGPRAPIQERVPAGSETKQAPPPHNPNPHPQQQDR